MSAKGIRNNNPGNVRRSSEKWKGLASIQTDKEFFVMQTPEMGIRMMVKILQNYQNNYKLWTVSQIINRWAPPTENNTKMYIKNVCKALGVDSNEHINVFNQAIMLLLLKVMIQQENGEQPYTDEQLLEGIRLAGDKPND